MQGGMKFVNFGPKGFLMFLNESFLISGGKHYIPYCNPASFKLNMLQNEIATATWTPGVSFDNCDTLRYLTRVTDTKIPSKHSTFDMCGFSNF